MRKIKNLHKESGITYNILEQSKIWKDDQAHDP